MIQSSVKDNCVHTVELWLLIGISWCPWHSAVRWPAISTIIPNQDIKSLERTAMFLEHLICTCCVPDIIHFRCGNEFTSQCWGRVCCHHSSIHQLWTTFNHLKNCDTKQQNQTLNQYFRAIYNFEQDSCVKLVQLVDFTFNTCIHHSMLMTSFCANYN